MFESDEDDLLKSLKDISHNLGRLKSYTQYKNRQRLYQGNRDISDEFKPYFADLIQDEDWSYYIGSGPEFYTIIQLKKCLKKEGIEQEFENILDRMSETRDRLVDQGFDSKFIIYFNGKAQQVQNPDSYRIPLYKFTGIGEMDYKSYLNDNGYSSDEYLFAKIEFAIV